MAPARGTSSLLGCPSHVHTRELRRFCHQRLDQRHERVGVGCQRFRQAVRVRHLAQRRELVRVDKRGEVASACFFRAPGRLW